MEEQKKISIIIADDHDLVRRGLQLILSLYSEFDTIAEVQDGNLAVIKAKELSPNIIIMDLNMPNLNGIEATRQIKNDSAETKVLIVSGHEDDHYVLQVFRSGASGYLLKSSSPEQFRTAIHSVHTTTDFYCPHLNPQYLTQLLHPSRKLNSAIIDQLTKREREIIQLIAESKTHQEIGDQLHISVRTVDTHLNNILHKLDLHDRVSLVTFAFKNGLVVLSKNAN
jgi:two-component system, NarL family, response regulator NreC